MVESLTKVSGEEFIVKLLSGERDFSKMSIEENFDLNGHGAFKELKIYLETQDLQKAPVNISDSQVRYIKAKGLYLPFIVGRNANFRGANFEGANFGNANFRGAYLKNANFENTDLWLTNFREANFDSACLKSAYLKGTYLGYTNLENANLKSVRNLAEACNLGKAHFIKTRITSKERNIIEEALKEINRFIEED